MTDTEGDMMDIHVDTDTEQYLKAAEACEQSDDFTGRALDWATDHAERHAVLVELIEACYRDSPEFATWADDVAAGADVA